MMTVSQQRCTATLCKGRGSAGFAAPGELCQLPAGASVPGRMHSAREPTPARRPGRAMNPHDMQRVLSHLKRDPVVKAVYDAKSEEIGPNIFRFKAEIGAGASRHGQAVGGFR